MYESARWRADLVCLGQVKTKHAADEAAAAAALNMTLLGQVLFLGHYGPWHPCIEWALRVHTNLPL